MNHKQSQLPITHEQTPNRILMTTDTIGGVWNYALELAEELTKNQVKIALATMGKPLSATQWQAVKKIPHLQVFENRYKLEWMDNQWEDVAQVGTWLLNLAQQWQLDLVHLNGYVHAGLPWEVPAVVVGHSCVLSWWEAVKGEPAPASWDQYFQQVKRGLQAAEVVIAPSQAMLAALERLYGNFKKSQVIYNGRDSGRY